MALQFHPLPPTVFPRAARPYINRLNFELRDLFGLEGTMTKPIVVRRSDLTIARRGEPQVDVSRITPSILSVISGISTVVGAPALTFGLTNTVGSTTTALSVNSALALFSTGVPPDCDAGAGVAGLSATAANLGHKHSVSTAVPTVTYSATAGATGSATTLLRSDATLLASTFLRSSANASTLTLTDDGADQSLTGSLGLLKFVNDGGFTFTANDTSLTGAVVLGVNLDPDRTNNTGIKSNWSGGNVASRTLACWDAAYASFSGVLTTAIIKGFASSAFSFSPSATSDANNELYNIHLSGPTINTTNGGFVEVTTAFFGGPRRFISNPTVTAAYGIHLECPTISGTTQAGIYVSQRTAQATAAVRAGIVVDAHNSGTLRYSFYGVSDTAYFGGKAEVIGTLGVTGTATFGNTVTVAGNFRHSGTLIGLYTTAGVTQSTGWSVSNVTATKTLNGSSFNLNDVMNTLGTLLQHLQDRGDIAA